MRRTPAAVLTAAALAVLAAGCAAAAPSHPAPRASSPPAATMTASQACADLNSTQAAYGMTGTKGRAALQYVAVHASNVTLAGDAGAMLRDEVAGSSSVGQDEANWVNECMTLTGKP